MKKVTLVILLLLIFNQESQEKTKYFYHFRLTALSEKILDMFIVDPMNRGRINPSSSSIVLSCGEIQDTINELWVWDNELLKSCVEDIFLTKYKGYNIFCNGKILSKYIYKFKAGNKQKCVICDTLLNSYSKDTPIVFTIYDCNIYKIKRGTTINNIKIEKVPRG